MSSNLVPAEDLNMETLLKIIDVTVLYDYNYRGFISDYRHNCYASEQFAVSVPDLL